ncbi:MAG: hypothetical protein ACTSWN_00545 [Promethearchaeota archaeon]
MLRDFFRFSIGPPIAPNRLTIIGRGKKHGKTYRNQELRKNSSCKSGEQAALTLDDECTPLEKPKDAVKITIFKTHDALSG